MNRANDLQQQFMELRTDYETVTKRHTQMLKEKVCLGQSCVALHGYDALCPVHGYDGLLLKENDAVESL